MKLLRYFAYYAPEKFSSVHLIDDLNYFLSSHDIDCVYYMPTPSRGVSKETRAYYNSHLSEEFHNGRIKIKRYKMFKESKNYVLIALRYFLCGVVSVFKSRKEKDVDVIFFSSTPPTNGLFSLWAKKLLSRNTTKEIKTILYLQDMFPESLINVGKNKKNSILYKLGTIMSNYIYENVDLIICISEYMKMKLLKKGVDEEKIRVVYNWINCESVVRVDRHDNKLFSELGLSDDKFYITYAGNFGTSQSIETILNAALILQEEHPECDVSFIMFGTGVLYEKYQKLCCDLKLKNLSIFPLQPLERVSEVYSLGYASIVTCKKQFGTAMPSKTWSIMATSTPVLLSFDSDSEMRQIIEENNAGLFSEAEDVQGLVDNILYLYNNRDVCKNMGYNARQFVENNVSRCKNAPKVVGIIKEIV